MNATHAKLTLSEAEEVLCPFMVPLFAESIPLERSNHRILREPIRADRPYPSLDRVCMDGVAIKYSDWDSGIRNFEISGIAKAGVSPIKATGVNACIEVMTGAPCPYGCDTVIPVECINIVGNTVEVHSLTKVRQGQNIQSAGSDCTIGDVLVPEGAKLNPACAAIAASVGKDHIKVTRFPKIRMISTGDEIVTSGSRPEPWQLRGSNAMAMSTMVSDLARIECDWAADDPIQLEKKVRWGLEDSDMLVMSGGVSAGKFDLVPDILERVGVTMLFHKLAIRPGKPIWFGIGPGGKPVFGLPGNPVSFMICFRRFAMPVLQAMAGKSADQASFQIRLGERVRVQSGLTLFHPVKVVASRNGERIAYSSPTNGSGDFCGLGRSDGFVEIASEMEFIPGGDYVPYFPWGD